MKIHQHVQITQFIDGNSVPSFIFKQMRSNHFSRPKSTPNSNINGIRQFPKNYSCIMKVIHQSLGDIEHIKPYVYRFIEHNLSLSQF